MATKLSFGKIELDVSPGGVKTARRRDPDAPFVLAVLGDFSGRGNRGVVEPINQRRVWKVDCDNFEQVVAKLGARLGFALAEGPTGAVELKFDSFEDLHPDRLLRMVAPLAALSEARKRLLDPAASADAARELQALLSAPASATEARAPSPASAESNEDTLARLLGRPAPPTATKQPQSDAVVDRLIRNIVAPSIVPGASSQQKALLSAADLELSRRLRMMLHHADFQALEANWRGLDMLVRHFGGEENLQIRVADISRQEIEADLMAAESLGATGLGKLIQQQMDEQPWSAWVGLYTFDARVDDLELLGRVTKLAAGVGAPFLAAAAPRLAGCDSFASHPDSSDWNLPLGTDAAAAWQALRELPESAYAALALPRFLLRQPYGRQSDPIASLEFEELPADIPHENYLWGNPAVLCGYRLAEAFRAEGWEMRPGGFGEIDELPLHKFKADDEMTVKPCAEAWLSQRAGDALSDKGLVPVLSIKGRDAVRVGPLRSLRTPAAALAGYWAT